MKTIIIFSVFSFALLSLLSSVEIKAAAIYKCVNAKSEVYYNDKPCPVNDKESQIESVKDPEGGYIPPAYVDSENDVQRSVRTSKKDSPRSINSGEKGLSKDENLASGNKESNSSANNSGQNGSQNSSSSTNNSSDSQSNNGFTINTDSEVDTNNLETVAANVGKNKGHYANQLILEPRDVHSQ